MMLGLLRKEWKLLDIVDSNSDWNTGNWYNKWAELVLAEVYIRLLLHTVKTLNFDGQFTLGDLYSMERNGIPVLTELIENSRRFHSNLCGMATDQDSIMYKWPTLHTRSPYEPTWRKLCFILQLNDKKKLAKAIKRYLKQKKGSYNISM